MTAKTYNQLLDDLRKIQEEATRLYGEKKDFSSTSMRVPAVTEEDVAKAPTRLARFYADLKTLQAYKQFMQDYRDTYPEGTPSDNLEKQALDKLMQDNLFSRYGKLANLSETDIDSYIRKLEAYYQNQETTLAAVARRAREFYPEPETIPGLTGVPNGNSETSVAELKAQRELLRQANRELAQETDPAKRAELTQKQTELKNKVSGLETTVRVSNPTEATDNTPDYSSASNKDLLDRMATLSAYLEANQDQTTNETGPQSVAGSIDPDDLHFHKALSNDLKVGLENNLDSNPNTQADKKLLDKYNEYLNAGGQGIASGGTQAKIAKLQEAKDLAQKMLDDLKAELKLRNPDLLLDHGNTQGAITQLSQSLDGEIQTLTAQNDLQETTDAQKTENEAKIKSLQARKKALDSFRSGVRGSGGKTQAEIEHEKQRQQKIKKISEEQDPKKKLELTKDLIEFDKSFYEEQLKRQDLTQEQKESYQAQLEQAKKNLEETMKRLAEMNKQDGNSNGGGSNGGGSNGGGTTPQTPEEIQREKDKKLKEAMIAAQADAKKEEETSWWSRNQWIWWALGAVAIGVLGFFGFKKGGWFNKKKSDTAKTIETLKANIASGNTSSTLTDSLTNANTGAGNGVNAILDASGNSVTFDAVQEAISTNSRVLPIIRTK